LNFILIGIPNSGKTTLGKRAAAVLGMRFYDTDISASDHIRSRKQLPSLFHFRHEFAAAEKAVVRRIAKEAENAVIATGAETALSKNNEEVLRRCGRFIHIKRDPDRILKEIRDRGSPNPDRPEVRDGNELLVELYRNTIPEYEKMADFTLENDDDEEAGLEGLVKIIRAEGNN
jgi:shikimate kinase